MSCRRGIFGAAAIPMLCMCCDSSSHSANPQALYVLCAVPAQQQQRGRLCNVWRHRQDLPTGQQGPLRGRSLPAMQQHGSCLCAHQQVLLAGVRFPLDRLWHRRFFFICDYRSEDLPHIKLATILVMHSVHRTAGTVELPTRGDSPADCCYVLQCQPAAKASTTRPHGRRLLQALSAPAPSPANPGPLGFASAPQLAPADVSNSTNSISSSVPDYGQCAGSGFGDFNLSCSSADFTCVRISDEYWQVRPSSWKAGCQAAFRRTPYASAA